MIELCNKFNCATHIVHVSSAEALPVIEQAKKAGLPLTAETCAHYIYFNAENIPDGNTLYKCAPPIREKENNQLLKDALASGVLDFVTTDHSPAPASVKEIESGDLQKAWGGIAGLQFLLSSAYTALKDNIPIEVFIPLLTEHPAKFLNLDKKKGFLKKGFDADIVIWEPAENFVVKEENVLHRHSFGPFNGEELNGSIKQTIVNGTTVYKENKIIHKNAGEWLLRK
jgi:allantoinase